MDRIVELMANDHRACDEEFAAIEQVAKRGDWAAAAAALKVFRDAMERHLGVEEKTLFPAFEAATGMTSGPTEVMRGEHRQMRDLLAQMQGAVESRDGDAFGGAAETLLILMQQHNMKEENILYPMCDNALGTSDVGASLVERLK